MEHKSGFVNIIGNPNVGKSTLMNAMVGERLSIITPKAQTTRHRIFGILNEPEYQIVFSDTPGVIQPAYKMQEHMMKFVSEAFDDADVFGGIAKSKGPEESKSKGPIFDIAKIFGFDFDKSKNLKHVSNHHLNT